MRSRPLASFIEPCLPRPADRLPAGSGWIHEIKHDGFRIMARRDKIAAPRFEQDVRNATDPVNLGPGITRSVPQPQNTP
jgi:hypothetical protein